MKINALATTLILAGLSFSAQALTIQSKDIKEGSLMPKIFEGCGPVNQSPELHWKSIPKGTKSFALTVYDPDAPTESGFWHWLVTDIPVNVTSLSRGAKVSTVGAVEIRNDSGKTNFKGACPPIGDGMHRYQFTIWALPESKLGVSSNTPAAQVGFKLNAIALGKATLTSTYVRQ